MRFGRRAVIAALVGAIVSPSLAFAGVSAAERRRLLGEAWARAAKARRALLVIVIPADDARWYERGRSLGIWLNHVPDADLARLAEVEPVCATLDELARLIPGVETAGDAGFVLVRVDAETPTWRSVRVPEPSVPAQPDFDDFLVAHANEPYEQVEEAYRAQARDHDTAYVEAVVAAYRGSVVRVLVAEGVPGGDVGEARARWVMRAPPGAHWGLSGGCGTTYEDVNDDSGLYTMCGMGHVAAYERRFLAFWDLKR